MNNTSVIVGAGLSGLITACAFPEHPVLEAGPKQQMHQALLRFRSEAVSQLTGIPFKKVLVRKGIWHKGQFTPATIRMSNMYSKKCLGLFLGNRSIWNIDAVERYIAPEDFHRQLIKRVGEHRIHYDSPADLTCCASGTINTAPLPVVLNALDIKVPGADFNRAAITVSKYKIRAASGLYQTIYFPTHQHSMYRASITDKTLIVEFIGVPINKSAWENELRDAFGMRDAEFVPILTATQNYGKIDSIPAGIRKALLFQLTAEYGLYSVGRFATWRNILLDDLVKDIAVVKDLMTADSYTHQLIKT